MPSFSDLIEAKEVASARLLTRGERAFGAAEAELDNVHAVGIGRSREAGASEEDRVVLIYAESLEAMRDSIRIALPESLDGVQTELVESPRAIVFARESERSARAARTPGNCSRKRKTRRRPVLAGVSASHGAAEQGTIACFCRSTNPSDLKDDTFVLSNNHVFALYNAADIGDQLFQPSILELGAASEVFATLHRFIPVTLPGPNYVDAAIGRVIDGTDVNPVVCSIGGITGIIDKADGLEVCKHGRTSGLTKGAVTATNVDAIIPISDTDPNRVALFKEQLRIDPVPPFMFFAMGGDSGSLVIEQSSNAAVGLLFAREPGGGFAYANPISTVLEALDLEILEVPIA